ncbi:MAG: translocation/assembly module TamB domain-containing protein [Prevotella sp.]|nr:translocation/assembly module TamB domain-containing protein [Prevotella sp.]
MKKFFLWAGIVLLSPIILFAILVGLLYCEPVQNWAVDKVAAYASETTGMEISVGHVSLDFPLNLSIEGVKVIQQNAKMSQVKDTVANIDRVIADVQLLPLFGSKVIINALEVNGAEINTTDFVEAAQVKGVIGRLYLASRGIDLKKETVEVNGAEISNVKLDIALNDSVPEDTVKTPTLWKIYADNLKIENTDITLHTPKDSMRVQAFLGRAEAKSADIDLGAERYAVGSVDWNDGWVKYDQMFEPTIEKGLDYNHISLTGVNIGVDSLLYQPSGAHLVLRRCEMKEKSGLQLESLTATIDMDTTRVNVPSLILRTTDSNIEARADIDINVMDEHNPGKAYLRLNAGIGKQDLMLLCGGMPQSFVQRYPNQPLTIIGSVNGNMRHVDFTGVDVKLPTAFHLTANGYTENANDMDRLKADVKLNAETQNMNFVMALADPTMMKDYRIPSGMTMKGHVTADGKQYAADLDVREGRGTVKAKGNINTASMRYAADVAINNLNIHHFMPKQDMYGFTGTLTAKGQGFDVFSPKTTMKAKAEVKDFKYSEWTLDKMIATADMENGRARVSLDSNNELIDGKIDLDALVAKKKVDLTLGAELNKADFYGLGLMKNEFTLGLCAHIDLASNLDDYYKLQGIVNDFTLVSKGKTYRPKDLTVDLFTNRDTTWAKVNSGNLDLDMAAKGGYELLMKQGEQLMAEIARQTEMKTIDQARIRKMLPIMRLKLESGDNNPVANFLRFKGFAFDETMIAMRTSPERGIDGIGHIYSLVADSNHIDTVKFRIYQAGGDLKMNAQVRNNKYNPQFVFNSLLRAEIHDSSADFNVKFYDANNELGGDLGLRAEVVDSGMNIHINPYTPIIGYTEFAVNDDNFVFLGADKKIRAKVDMIAKDGTGVKLYSEDNDSTMLQDLTLSLNHFDLDRLTAVVPYAMPRLGGIMNGDFHMLMNSDQKISVLSDLGVNNMEYEHSPIGNVASEIVYLQEEDDTHFVQANIVHENREVGVLSGTYYNADGGRLDATFDMNRLPLSMANGFVPDQILGLEGYAEGEVSVKGALDALLIDGEITLDSTYLVSVPYGMNLRFTTQPVRIVGSNLHFDKFSIYAHNNNPLNINGDINFANLDNILVNLTMVAKDYQMINAKQTRRSLAYGKAFVNFGGYLRGNLDNLQMRGKLDVLGKTDLTYILKDSPLNTDDQLKELVTFTDFRDTLLVADVNRPPVNGLDMLLMVNIEQGARMLCELNADHSNYVELEGGGELRMTYTPMNDLQLFGRYTVNSGEMKYALPIIPLKTFNIAKDSYVEFNGDIMNPTLNLTATEQVKALVGAQTGNSRSVLFECGVKVTQTLQNMGLEFTLDAPDDMTVKNELIAMGPEQRGKLSVTMLTTGMYLADGNTSGFSMNSAFNSFLQNEINNITSNALRTVDISLGLDQSSDAAGNLHTDYSFRFAKRFWNNRLNFIIGGKYSDANTVTNDDGMFIDNVSLEYRLDETAMRYVRMFYNKEKNDLLEGRIAEYGAGFVWRKKMSKLSDIFRGKQPMLMRGNLQRPLSAPQPQTQQPNDTIR